MWRKKINIYILTSDRGIDTIEGFQYCFNKYWNSSQQVTILGYRSPTFKLSDNFKFISLGEDRGRVTGTVYVQYSSKAVNDYVVLPTQEGNTYVQFAHVDYDGTGFNNMNSQFSGDELISVNITYISA